MSHSVAKLIRIKLNFRRQKTFARYWDFSIPSAEVQPTTISKYNTALQLMLVGATTVSPLLPFEIALPLYGLQ